MKHLSFLGLSFLLVFLLSACKVSSPVYSKREKRWKAEDTDIPEQNIAFTVYLIGDAGIATGDPPEPVLQLLQSELQLRGQQSAVVFLGDNIYQEGMSRPEDPARAEAEQRLGAQLSILKGYKGQPFFIPGNHDWSNGKSGGREAVLRQMAFIDSVLGNENSFYPRDACGDPKAIVLTDNLTLLLIDSQWWLQDWEHEENINKGCKVDSREEFLNELAELVDEYDDTNLLLCMHHPLYSTGIHGGYAPLNDHLFPLRKVKPYLFLPLPVLGSLYPTARYMGISEQDLTHKKNIAFQEAILEAIFRIEDVVVASGHEHVLEYFSYDRENQHYIVSGSGSKRAFAKAINDGHKEVASHFLYRNHGFSRITYMKDGTVWLEFLAPDNAGGKGELLFRKKIHQAAFTASDPVVSGDPGQPEPVPDSVKVVANADYQAGFVKRLFLGKQYRKAWAAEIKLPVLDMSTKKGGLIPIRKGGGQTSQNLRLEGMDGQQYVIRSIEKDASSYLPLFAKNTVIDQIVQDQFSMVHPYGALLVGPLADAAGVFHTNPEFYFVPTQQNLGDFAPIFANKPYLFEERPAKNWEVEASFGNSEKIISYRKLLRRTREHVDHKVDQLSTIRARLFDMWVCDFDRHDDQFRWAQFKEGDMKYYKPIPRDRDMAFFRFQGILPWLSSRIIARELHSFSPRIQDVVGLNKSATWFDRSFLNEMGLADWENAAREMQVSLTDELIEETVKLWPDTLYALDGEYFEHCLKSRRDGLLKAARKYYAFISRQVDVVGTKKRDEFIVERLNDEETRVQVFALSKEGDSKVLCYERVFFHKETQEIRLYGLEGDDSFLIKGEAKKGPLLRVIAGEGDDRVVDESRLKKVGKQTRVYDTQLEDNHLQLGKEGKDLTSTHWEVNDYNRKEFKYPFTLPLLIAGLNPDDGVILGAGLTMTRYGFRKAPYKSKQSFGASIAFATGALNFKYKGEFIELMGKWDLGIQAHFFGNSHVQNFFGFGNETEYDGARKNDFDYYRMHYRQFRFHPQLIRAFNQREHAFVMGLGLERTDAERDAGRISDKENDDLSGLSDEDFLPKLYGFASIGYRINKTDHPFKPTRGIRFNADASFNNNLEDLAKNFTQLTSSLTIYYTLDRIKTTLASRVGGGINLGSYEFFQAQYLGRRNNLRGYRGERFGGDAIFYQNTDLRVDLLRIRSSFVPTVIGILGFVDYGRSWYEGAPRSQVWHVGYGGGVYIQMFDQILMNVSYAISKETKFIEFGLGFFL